VAAVLQELIGQITVGSVKFHAVKACGSCALGGFAIVLDNASNF
jgi:hypothetical protein